MSINSTTPFFQIPKFIINHPLISGDHIYIFMILYDQLRQEPYITIGYNKTNDYLSEITKIGKRQFIVKLNQLEEWGFLTRKGYGQQRKFFLGKLFDTSAEKEPVQKLNSAEKEPILCGKGTEDRAKKDIHNKNLLKIYTKNDFVKILDNPKSTQLQRQAAGYYLKNPNQQVTEEHRQDLKGIG